MINNQLFARSWEALEARFGKQPKGSAANYLTYLSPLLENDEFTEAARAVWATREFFPRPADFLMIRQGQDWEKIQEAAGLARKRLDWSGVFQAMSGPGQMSVRALGGIFVIGERLQAHPGLVRKDYGREYEMAITTLAIRTALPPGEKSDALPEVTVESRKIMREIMTKQLPSAQDGAT